MAKELHLHAGGDLDTLLEEIREAQSANLENLTLYNLDLSLEVANALVDLIRAQLKRRLVSSNWKDDSGREAQPLVSSFTLEILGGKGFVDRIVEAYVSDHRISSEENDVKRELILVHSHPDGFDTSVFAALGMALDGRRAKYATESLGLLTPKLRLSLYQPVLSDTKTWTLAQGIGESCCLQELDLSSNSFDPLIGSRMIQNLAESLQRNKHLVCLRFKNCCLVDEQIVSLMGGLRGHPTLQQLELSGNKCRSAGLVAIASALSFTSAQSDHAGAKLPAFSLDLTNQHINKQNQSLLDDSMFQAWSRHRSFTDRLETLNLSGNKLDDADLSMVVSLLLPNTTESEQQDSSSSHLRGLDLSRNCFSDQGIHALADVIKTYRVVYPCDNARFWKKLNLTNNPSLAKESFQQLASAMEINLFLEELLFDYPLSGEDSVTISAIKDIQFCLSLNKGGRKVLDRRYPAIPMSLWPVLLARVNRQQYHACYSSNDVMFHLLSQGPVLKDRG